MDEEFTIGGQRISLTAQQIKQKLRRVSPEAIQTLTVEVNGVEYPVKQALAASTGLDRADFTSHEAWRVLRKLGFRVSRRR